MKTRLDYIDLYNDIRALHTRAKELGFKWRNYQAPPGGRRPTDIIQDLHDTLYRLEEELVKSQFDDLPLFTK